MAFKESEAKKQARFKWNLRFKDLLSDVEHGPAFWQSADFYRICEKLTPEQAAERYKKLLESESK